MKPSYKLFSIFLILAVCLISVGTALAFDDFSMQDFYMTRVGNTSSQYNVTLTGKIFFGSTDPRIVDVPVRFYFTNAPNDHTTITTSVTVLPNTLTTVSIPWIYSQSYIEIVTVVVDPDRTFNETDYNNNNKTISYITMPIQCEVNFVDNPYPVYQQRGIPTFFGPGFANTGIEGVNVSFSNTPFTDSLGHTLPATNVDPSVATMFAYPHSSQGLFVISRIPHNQPIGTYTGTLTLTYNNLFNTFSKTTVMNVIVQNTAPVVPVAIVQDATVNTPTIVSLGGTDINNDTLTYIMLSSPLHGTISNIVNGPGGSLTYTPNPGYLGPDSWLFKANDGDLDSNPGSIVINVQASAPTITLLGNNPMNIEVFSAFANPGATAKDYLNNDITSRITTSNNVNVSKIGTYAVTYTVSDTFTYGRTTTVTRTVNVVDTTKPLITVLGSTTIIVGLGSTYTDAGATASDNYDGVITSRIVVTSNVNTSKIGTYTVNYYVADNSGNNATASRVIIVKDLTFPVITILGSNPARIQVGTAYTDAGATASDNVDGNITSRIVVTSNVNSNVIGTYTVTYNVTDNAGNNVIATRTVNVVSDITSPVITILGSNPVTVQYASTYTDAGATASDNIDGIITSRIVTTNPVNTHVLGVYTVTYTVSDNAGNTATATRTVNVVDTTAPVITILGSNPDYVLNGNTYTDSGATATDNYDGVLTSSITKTSNVDISTDGTYSVIYTVKDSHNNTAIATRTVYVYSSITDYPPTITILGLNPVAIVQGSVYVDAGATASDTEDGSLTSSIIVSNPVNTAILGTYYVTYTVTDSGSNTVIATRTVNVVAAADVTPPVQSAGLPTGTMNVSTVTLSLTTDETATCKYSVASGIAYASMTNTFATTGGTVHSQLLSSLSDGVYNYYVRCQDVAGNPNTNDYVISFNISLFPGSNVTNSTVTNSTVTNSTITNSTVTNSTVTNSTVTNSTVTNSTLTNSTVTNSTVTNSTVINSTVTNSTINSSTVINSTSTNSTITNSTLTNSTFTNSTIIGSNVTNSNFTNSNVTNATILGAGCNLINSTILNTVLNVSGYCFIKNEVHINENITGVNFTSSFGDPVGNNVTTGNFNSTNSTYDYNIISGNYDTFIRSTINHSTTIDAFIIDSTVLNSIVNLSNIINSTVTNSTVMSSTLTNSISTNSTIISSNVTGSNIINSNITNSVITNSTVNASTITNSTVVNSNITNSTILGSNITNSTVINSNITNSYIFNANASDALIINGTIYNGTITTFNGTIYNATASGPANLTALINYPPVAVLVTPASVLVSTVVNVNGSGSSDLNIPGPLNDSLTYFFNFGDGTNYTESVSNATDGIYDGTTTHTYASAGTYTITLTVTDRFGISSVASNTITVTVVAPPPSGGGGSGSGSSGGGGGGGYYVLSTNAVFDCASGHYVLTAPADFSADANTTIEIPLKLTGDSSNSSCWLSSGKIDVTKPLGWSYETLTTPSLAPNGSVNIKLKINVPSDAGSGVLTFKLQIHSVNLTAETSVTVRRPATNVTIISNVKPTENTTSNQKSGTGTLSAITGNIVEDLSSMAGWLSSGNTPIIVGGAIIVIAAAFIGFKFGSAKNPVKRKRK